jgi:hypothetical protein
LYKRNGCFSWKRECDATRANVVVSHPPCEADQPEEDQVERVSAYRELIAEPRQAYREADPTTKRAVLDEIITLTGYHRSYVRWLLNLFLCEELGGLFIRRTKLLNRSLIEENMYLR